MAQEAEGMGVLYVVPCATINGGLVGAVSPVKTKLPSLSILQKIDLHTVIHFYLSIHTPQI